MKNKSIINLSGYSALAAATLSIIKADAQIVYTNIDDVKIEWPSPRPYFIDLNNDGKFDYGFGVKKVEGVYWASVLDAWGNETDNEVAGLGNGMQFHPFKLSAMSDINEDVNWIEINPLSYNPLAAYSWSSFHFGFWKEGVRDGFLGTRFMIDGQRHYGWVRLAVSKDAATIIVKDYAYNSVPEMPLVAGQTFKEELVFMSATDQSINLYPNPASEYVMLSFPGQEQVNSKCSIYDMSGELLLRVDKLEGNKMDIRQLSNGSYILHLQNENGVFVTKLNIQR